MRNHRFRELGKDVLIGILAVGVVVLTLMALPTGLVAERLPLRTMQEEVAAEPQAVTAASEPLVLSAKTRAGRMSLRRDGAALEMTYDRWSPLLGEALETATMPRSVTQREYLAALSGESLFYGFPGKVPIAALCSWLGVAEESLSGGGSEYVLALEKNGVELYLNGDGCTAWKTELAPEKLRQLLRTCVPDGSSFAFEQPEKRRVAPTVLWESGAVRLSAAFSENPCGGTFAEELAEKLGFNPYGAGSYTDPRGNSVFTESNRTCTVSLGGEVVLEQGDGIFGGSSAAERIEQARSLLETICGGMTGEGKLTLRDYTENGSTAHCSFLYVLNGVQVLPTAAEASFTENGLTELRVLVRAYHREAGTLTVMPLPQAAAIAPAESFLTVAYGGDGTMTAGWTE